MKLKTRFPISPRLWFLLLIAAVLAMAAKPVVAEELKSVRVGYQRYSSLSLLKERGALDARLLEGGVKVEWVLFPAGPQLMEAMNAGAVDLGETGEAPPIFAQSANVPFVYFAAEPARPESEGLRVPDKSGSRSLAELKGKRVALNRGSNVHLLLLKALEREGLAMSDIQPMYLAPADARAAFESGAVDAWAIWDAYLTSAKNASGARVLATGEGLVANRSFFLARSAFAAKNPEVLHALTAEMAEVDRWTEANPRAVAELLAPAIHVDVETLTEIVARTRRGASALDEETIQKQQEAANAFQAAGLISNAPSVADATWNVLLHDGAKTASR